MCWAPHRNRRSERVGDDIVCTAARFFVPFLFPLTGVMRLGYFEAGLCIVQLGVRRVLGDRRSVVSGVEGKEWDPEWGRLQ